VTRRWFGIVLGLWASGCGVAPAPRYPSSQSAEPSLDIRFRDNLGWPYSLERLLVVLDGAVLFDRETSKFPATFSVAHLSDLPPGDHTLQVLVRLRYPTGRLGESCLLEAATARSFTTTPGPMDVMLDVYASGVTESFRDRIVFEILVNGDLGRLRFENYGYDREDPCA
jgi:hypothetical protein